ncbi:hypothetical protein B0H14DRAFT_1429226 [Mycena olivaceomarginata]|nr:hypothetical protein B0H14DRAFT_1429226 [Mycena olivaceomarginata]
MVRVQMCMRPFHDAVAPASDLHYRPRRVSAVHFATRARARLQGSLRDQDDRRLAVLRFRLSTLPATKAEELRLELRFVVPRTELNVDTGIILDARAQLWDSGEDVWRPLRRLPFPPGEPYTVSLTELEAQANQRILSTQGARPVARHLGERVVEAVPSGGNDPALPSRFPTTRVAIMNYSSGDRLIIPTTTSPEHYNNDAPVITFPPPARGLSHPHLNVSDGTRVYSNRSRAQFLSPRADR